MLQPSEKVERLGALLFQVLPVPSSERTKEDLEQNGSQFGRR